MRHFCSSWAQFFVLNALAAASLVGVTVCANAQEPQTRPSTAEALKRIAADAVALLTIRPSVILHDEAMKLLPLEVMTAAGKEQFGIDPLKVERVDIIVGLPGPDGPQFAALLTFGEDMSVEQLIPQAFSRLLPGAGEMVFYFSDARHLLFGPQAYAERLIKTELADGHLRRLVGKLGEPGQFSAVVALEPMRESLAGLSQMPSIPGPIAPQVATLADKLTMVALRIDIGSRPMTAVALEAADPSDLEAVEASWKKSCGSALQRRVSSMSGTSVRITLRSR